MSSDNENFYAIISKIDGTTIDPDSSISDIDSKLIDISKFSNIYYDTIFHLHLYNSLYIAFLKYNDDNFNNITRFTELVNNLNIFIDNTTNFSSGVGDVCELIAPIISSSNYTFNFYAKKCIDMYSTTIGSNAITGTETAQATYIKSLTYNLIVPNDDISLGIIYSSSDNTNYSQITTPIQYTQAVSNYNRLYTVTSGTYTKILSFPIVSDSSTYYILTSDLDTSGSPKLPKSYITVNGMMAIKSALTPYIYDIQNSATVISFPIDTDYTNGKKYKMKYSDDTISKSSTIYGGLNDLKIGLLCRIYTTNNIANKAISFPNDGDTNLTYYVLTSDLDQNGIIKSGIIPTFIGPITNTTDLKNSLLIYIYNNETNIQVGSFPTSFISNKYYIKYSIIKNVSSSDIGSDNLLKAELRNRIFTKTSDIRTDHTPTYSVSSTYNSGGASVQKVISSFVSSHNSHYDRYISNGNQINTKYTNHLPILLNTQCITATSAVIADTIPASLYGISFNKNTDFNAAVRNIDNNINNSYDETYRKNRLLHTIKEILNNSVETMMGYLFYNKILYNIVLYNLEIQYSIRVNYLNNSNVISNIGGDENYISKNNASIVVPVTTIIDYMKANMITLKTNLFKQTESDYVSNKYAYTNKISVLDNMKENFNKINNSLNISVKEYNRYINNFIAIKKYANFIIIILIIIIIITILITILTNLTQEFKNNYYIITLIILSTITYIFYNRFNHVNLYEKFTLPDITSITRSSIYTQNQKTNNIQFFNQLVPYIKNYTIEMKSLISELKKNIYTIDNRLFSSGTDSYLFKLYVEKKNLNETNRLKKVNLTNMIENMKKQILYLFNIILLLSCLTIIILIGLMIHSIYPFLITYIIILCSILIVIIVVYFVVAIVQPTRMIASKNYWANNRPTETILNKL